MEKHTEIIYSDESLNFLMILKSIIFMLYKKMLLLPHDEHLIWNSIYAVNNNMYAA